MRIHRVNAIIVIAVPRARMGGSSASPILSRPCIYGLSPFRSLSNQMRRATFDNEESIVDSRTVEPSPSDFWQNGINKLVNK